jgi:hypothetical protein
MLYPVSAVTGVPSVLVVGEFQDRVAVPFDDAVTVIVVLSLAVPPEPLQVRV